MSSEENIESLVYKPYHAADGLRAELISALNAVRGALDFCELNPCPNHKRLFLHALRLLEPAIAHALYIDGLTEGWVE